jgi:polysaccharide biosynthesis protein PslJ
MAVARVASGSASVGARNLPAWPLYLLFVGFPLWWVLGLAGFVWVLLAVPMLLSLAGGRVRAPHGFGLWLGFLLWMVASALKLDSLGRVIGFGFRAGLYLSATLLFLYVYNASSQTLPPRRVALIMTAFWVVVVAGGFLGLRFPEGHFSTPTQKLLPGSLLANEFVYDLVHPSFAQVNAAGRVAPRPQAPFPYTNQWGASFALLLPFVLYALTQVRQGLRRLIMLVLLASLVPVFLSLNRGLWVSLGFGLVYAALRFALRGRLKALLGVLLLVAVAGQVAVALPLDKLLNETKQESNKSRLELYQEAVQDTIQSPLLGYGAPRPSDDPYSPSVGTQGQLWMVLFSHGFPGVALFLAWFLWIAWRTRGARTPAQLWTHTVLLIAIVQLPFYGMLPAAIHIVMVAAAVSLRESGAGPPAVAASLSSAAKEPTSASVMPA